MVNKTLVKEFCQIERVYIERKFVYSNMFLMFPEGNNSHLFLKIVEICSHHIVSEQ